MPAPAFTASLNSRSSSLGDVVSEKSSGNLVSLPEVLSTHGVNTPRGSIAQVTRLIHLRARRSLDETQSDTDSAPLELKNRIAAQQVEKSRLANQQSSLADFPEKVQFSSASAHKELLSVISQMQRQVMMKLESIDLKVCERSANVPMGSRRPKSVALERCGDVFSKQEAIELEASEADFANCPRGAPNPVALESFSDVRSGHQVKQERYLRAVIQEEPQSLSASSRSKVAEENDPETPVARITEDLHATACVQDESPIVNRNSVSRFHRLNTLAEAFDTRLGYDAMWEVYRNGSKGSSFWMELAERHGFEYLLVGRAPDTFAARVTQHPYFALFQTALILSNTVMMAYEADLSMKASLKIPKESVPDWLYVASTAFNIVFVLELLFRLFSLRLWFWVAPGDWTWNVFDFVLVISSLALDTLTGESGFGFLRTFRLLRLLRIARIIRVLRFFRQLREMLFAIMACFTSLVWSFVFMGIVLALFSLMCIQGANEVLDQMHDGSLAEDAKLRGEIETVFGSMPDAMLSLLASVTGGTDWLSLYHPLTHSGFLYPAVYVCYMLFLTLGVMNVLTGVFLANAEQFVDTDLITQNQESKTETFVHQMITLFGDMDDEGSGELTFEAFNKALSKRTVQAFLQHSGLDTTHAQLIFELIDRDAHGSVEMHEFVMGMVRLKGTAKAIDSRLILRELSMIPKLFRELAASPN